MNNLVLITSIIDTPNTSLSYSDIRSVFSRDERFEQTKLTIQSVRDKIPNSKILLIECTEFTNEEKEYFNTNCDYVLNLINDKYAKEAIYSQIKLLGECTYTVKAIEYIKENNLQFDNLSFLQMSDQPTRARVCVCSTW
jgi:hypothetical protein